MKFALSIGFVFLITIHISGQNLYDSANTSRFGNYLYNTGQYEDALLEFQTHIGWANTNDTLSSKFLGCYLKLNRAEDGLMKAKQLFPTLSTMPILSSKVYVRLLKKQDQWAQASDFVEKSKTLMADQKAIYDMRFAMQTCNWKLALNKYHTYDSLGMDGVKAYKSILDEALIAKYKQPLKAAVLSTIVPGLGKIYTGDVKDAIFAFVVTGVSAFQAIRGFQVRGTRSVYGYLYAGFTLGFYTGNIYGSWRSAKKHNHRINDEFLNAADRVVAQY
jgi:hypothetical protein